MQSFIDYQLQKLNDEIRQNREIPQAFDYKAIPQNKKGFENLMTDILNKYVKRPATGHEAIDNLIAKADAKDDFRFGKYGNIQTNLIKSLLKGDRDLLNIGISGKLGKSKEWDYSLGGGKDNYGFNISRWF